MRADATAFITYSASAPLTDLGTIDAYSDVPDIDLVPLTVEAMPPVDETYELEVTFDTMDDGTNHAMFNQVTYNAPLVPTILSERTLAENATVAGAYGPNHIVVDHLKVFDIVVQNGDAGKHPLCVASRLTPCLADPVLSLPCTERRAAICTGTRCRSWAARRTTRPTTRR